MSQTTTTPELESMVLGVAGAVEDCIQEAMPERNDQLSHFYHRVTEEQLHRHIRDALRPTMERIYRLRAGLDSVFLSYSDLTALRDHVRDVLEQDICGVNVSE